MRRLYIFFILMAYHLRVQSVSPCDSQYCVCKFDVNSDKDLFSGTIDCSHDPKLLEREFTLPNTVYALNLSWNYIPRIKSNLFQSDTLTELYLSNNRISDIDSPVLRLPRLKKLDLSDNKLEYIAKDVFVKLRELEYLNLANNRFTHFEKLMLHPLGNLVEIILDDNNLGESLSNYNLFDRSGYGLTNKIKSLSINGIHLNFVHDNFFVDAYDLRKLSMARNNLTDVFELPFTLEYLDLSDNPIEEISGEDFADLLILKELKLNNLGIQEISDSTFASLHALVSLELERNINLTSFNVNAFGREVLDDADDFTLEKLSLKNSRLQTLDQKLETPFGQLIHLDLQGNLWHCNCKLAWIKELQIPAKDYERLRCFTPQFLFNSKIFELDQKYFTCQVNNNHVGIGIAVVTTCVALTAMAFWIFTYSPKLRSTCLFVKYLHAPTTEYTVLPVHSSINDY